MSAEFESYLETLGNVTEQECINSDVINDGRLSDDIGIEKVTARNEKIRARNEKAPKEVTLNRGYKTNSNSPVRANLDIGDSLAGKDDPENHENKFDSNKSGVTEVTGVTTNNDEACSGNPDKKAGVTGVTGLLDNAINPNEEPPLKILKVKLERPCYGVYDDFNEFGKAGVYYHGIKTDKKGDTTPTNDFICDPLHIDAGSCDSSDHNYGLMLRFKNQRFRWRKWLMPLEMLSGSCEELRGELLKMGLRIDHHKRNMLPSYLQSQRPKKQLE